MRRETYIALIVAVVAWFAQPAAAANETITIVADKWCPYNCGQDDKKQGYMIDIVREAMKKSNIDVVYKVMPWAEAVEETRKGKYDAIVGANHGDAPDFIYPEQLLGISITQVWVKNAEDITWEYKAPSSLDGMRIGIIKGYSYGKLIDPYLKKREGGTNGEISAMSTDNATEHNIGKLLTGRVDVIIEDKNVIEYYFASRKMPMLLKPAGNPVDVNSAEDTYVFIAFGPTNPKAKSHAEAFTKGLQEMRSNGELKAILANYNMNGIYRFMGTATADQ